MNIAILGYGVEGHAAERYFKSHNDTDGNKNEITVYNNFARENLKNFKLERYDLVLRSPSVPVHYKEETENDGANWSTLTRYFFDHCPAKIIGVTGTKGKGTTCSIITEILKSFGKTVHLVGNIGTPSIDLLDKIKEDDVVVYEMSSFQLWDLEKSPHIAVVLRIEPDHLNVHKDLDDYKRAKSNIASHQTTKDSVIYYRANPDSVKIANLSKGTKIPYPFTASNIADILKHLHLPGVHNLENAEAAIAAVAAFFNKSTTAFLLNDDNVKKLKAGLENFHGLPHRIQFVRALDDIYYYDDNYSSAFPALDVALKTFEKQQVILIAGGKDRKVPIDDIKKRIFSAPNLKKVILIGETADALSWQEDRDKWQYAKTLEDAVEKARAAATKNNVVLMSPGFPSFDMFKNFEDRGEQFQQIVKKLK